MGSFDNINNMLISKLGLKQSASRMPATPERAFVKALQGQKNYDIDNKAVLLSVARAIVPAQEMDCPRFPQFSLTSDFAQRRASILREHGKGYIKPVKGSGARGVAKLELSADNEIAITTKDNKLARVILISLPDVLTISELALDTIKIRMCDRADKTELEDNLVNFFIFFEELMKKHYGPTIFEGAIDTPLILGPNGQATWEIRTINQTVNGKIRQTSFAKVGASCVVANITKGGTGSDSKEAIKAAYRTFLHGQGKSEKEIDLLAEYFLEEAYQNARQIAQGLSTWFTLARERYLPEYPFAVIPMTNFSADFMGQKVGDRLVPFIVDINLYYCRRLSPVMALEVEENDKQIAAEFFGQVESL